MIINSNSPQLPRGSIGFALGIAGMLVSLYYSIMFIAGNATGIELVIGVVFALTLDYGKVALATEALYAKVAKTLGSTPEELQVKLAFARAVLLEIIAPIFVAIFLSAYRNRSVATHEKMINQTEQQPVQNSALPTQAQQIQQQPIQPQPLPSYHFSGLKW